MPEANGYDLIQQVRESQPQLRAIALTASVSAKDYNRALGAGFEVYVAKPVDPDEWLDAVVGLVQGSTTADD